MTITRFIRYEIDPFKKDQFTAHAENCARIIPIWVDISLESMYRIELQPS